MLEDSIEADEERLELFREEEGLEIGAQGLHPLMIGSQGAEVAQMGDGHRLAAVLPDVRPRSVPCAWRIRRRPSPASYSRSRVVLRSKAR